MAEIITFRASPLGNRRARPAALHVTRHGGCCSFGRVQTIFVVDDDPDQAELLAAALSADGRRIRAFSDPIRALAALQSEGADLLIADLSMPWLDGAQIVEAARGRRPELAIILVSGYARGAEVAAHSDLTFFGKPIDLDRLRAAVTDLLAQTAHRAGQEAG